MLKSTRILFSTIPVIAGRYLFTCFDLFCILSPISRILIICYIFSIGKEKFYKIFLFNLYESMFLYLFINFVNCFEKSLNY